MTLLEEIILAMNKLGGHCYYADLYEAVQEINPERIKNYKNKENWQKDIQSLIQRPSPDSKAFKGKKIFYAVEGIRQGNWGLIKPDEQLLNVDFSAEDESFKEGKKFLKQHLIRERNPYLKMHAIKKFKETHQNQVFCEICGFNFYDRYGELGRDYIELHHLKPVSQLQENETTQLTDTILLCSNCHSMVHRKRPWLSLTQLKEILQK